MTRGITTDDHDDNDAFEGGLPDDLPDDFDADFDPDRLAGCGYWRCDVIFERRTANQQFCRKACRSRQRKWERSQDRKARKAEAAAVRRASRR